MPKLISINGYNIFFIYNRNLSAKKEDGEILQYKYLYTTFSYIFLKKNSPFVSY